MCLNHQRELKPRWYHRTLARWLTARAKPWQFWLPQSGFVGGMIFCGLITLILITVQALVVYLLWTKK